MEGSALESCLLEAAEMGEAVLREEELRTAVEGMRNNDLDNREVPMQENKEVGMQLGEKSEPIYQ